MNSFIHKKQGKDTPALLSRRKNCPSSFPKIENKRGLAESGVGRTPDKLSVY